jgi:hypothetical protein
MCCSSQNTFEHRERGGNPKSRGFPGCVFGRQDEQKVIGLPDHTCRHDRDLKRAVDPRYSELPSRGLPHDASFTVSAWTAFGVPVSVFDDGTVASTLRMTARFERRRRCTFGADVGDDLAVLRG